MADALKEFSKNLSEAAKELAQREQVKANLEQDIKDLSRERDTLQAANVEVKKFIADSEAVLREGRRKHEMALEDANQQLQNKLRDFKLVKEEHEKKVKQFEKDQAQLERLKAQFKDEVSAYKNSSLSKSEQYKKILADLGI